jgi:hypothetical protein
MQDSTINTVAKHGALDHMQVRRACPDDTRSSARFFILGFYEQANVLLKGLYDLGHGLEFCLDMNTRPFYDERETLDFLQSLYEA